MLVLWGLIVGRFEIRKFAKFAFLFAFLVEVVFRYAMPNCDRAISAPCRIDASATLESRMALDLPGGLVVG
ncbi:hypothetical protein D3C80_1800290 [compost metagenome]